MAGNHPQPFPDENQSDTPFPSSSDEVKLEGTVYSFESFDYDPDEQEYRALFDSETIPPSMAVAGAVSAIFQEDPIDREPLYSVIDPDALDSIIARKLTGRGDVYVTFEQTGYSITVSSYGGIQIGPTRSTRTTPVERDER